VLETNTPLAKTIELWPTEKLYPFEGNARVHTLSQIGEIAASIREFGFNAPILADEDGLLIAGHGRLEAAKLLGLSNVPVIVLKHLTEVERRAFTIADNKIALNSIWSFEKLGVELSALKLEGFDMALTGFNDFELDQIFTGAEDDFNVSQHRRSKTGEGEDEEPADPAAANAKLAEKFLVPPFSVLDARQGYWKSRKNAWLGLGIQSELGRGENLLKMSSTMLEPDPEKRSLDDQMQKALKGNPAGGGSIEVKIPGYYQKIRSGMSREQIIQEWLDSNSSIKSGTSIFDPVLCEVAYRWFSPEGGTVLDPFAGGSVRGVVASKLGRKYYGCDLRTEQIEENKIQAQKVCDPIVQPHYFSGDSRNIDEHFPELKADMIFSCPPYADLEVYSDDPQDISTLEYEEFLEAYTQIITKAVAMLKPNRFAVFVVGEVREKKNGGFYKGFVQDTIAAFEGAGAKFYNEMLLLTPAGTLALRAGRVFSASRKVGKTHQNVLVFCKGDPFEATKACGDIEISLPEGMEDEASSPELDATEKYGERLTDIGGDL